MADAWEGFECGFVAMDTAVLVLVSDGVFTV